MFADRVRRTDLKGTHVGFMQKMNLSYDLTLYIFWKQFFEHLHIRIFLLPAAFDVQHESEA